MKLESLERKQMELLTNHGSGRRNVLQEIELSKAKSSLADSRLQTANERGAQALREEHKSRRLNSLLSQKQADMKKTALFNEKIRSRRLLLNNKSPHRIHEAP
ncbi:Uncharacterized protein FKW44_000751 [Caligus rogercresseyi]|uniref:Uncharacterized protein n=1 Tax=Caligus rogercresseyi TaxID=217165 RepID=A0A7T8KI02_CALRO|nr:Uncharacterized protein FKW44_000751 [Caligus rogercresseyi]